MCGCAWARGGGSLTAAPSPRVLLPSHGPAGWGDGLEAAPARQLHPAPAHGLCKLLPAAPVLGNCACALPQNPGGCSPVLGCSFLSRAPESPRSVSGVSPGSALSALLPQVCSLWDSWAAEGTKTTPFQIVLSNPWWSILVKLLYTVKR